MGLGVPALLSPGPGGRCEVTRIVRQLCGGDAILEETIQKKVPKTFFPKASPPKATERFRLTFNIPERTAENLFLYRTKFFVKHMLASPLYANCAVGKPWEMVGSVSEQLIDELLATCARDVQLRDVVQQLYQAETK
ncbi:hypothetical protein ABMA28_017127 [Loxostege sticticalis]|uniref:Uncharacterized protein n=1 Tax=Loxostege sticticalis TaxID=481309 RepID=A0ABD0T9Z1_LOXSC